MIGDLLAKLGKGELLTPREQEKLKMWGNNTELLGDFTAGLQTGMSDLSVNEISAQSGVFERTPNSSSFYAGNNKTFTSGYFDFDVRSWYDSNSLFIPYNDTTDSFVVNPLFVDRGKVVMKVSMRAEFSANDTVAVELEWHEQSDDSVSHSNTVIWDEKATSGGEILFAIVESSSIFLDLYAKVKITFTASREVNLNMSAERVF